MSTSESTPSPWDASLYQSVCSFVPEHGEVLLEQLNPGPSERILDFGCGTGELTARIHASAKETIGLDPSREMIEQARREHPEITFIHSTVENYHPDRLFDAVFSNAVLHWVPDLSNTLARIYDVLVPGGRFVGEFGARGNVEGVRKALHQSLSKRGYDPQQLDPWTFPSQKQFNKLLRQTGFKIDRLETVDRPTRIEGEEGLRIWLIMFGRSFFEPLGLTEEQEVVGEIIEDLRPDYFDGKQWTLEYRRLRFQVTRPRENEII